MKKNIVKNKFKTIWAAYVNRLKQFNPDMLGLTIAIGVTVFLFITFSILVRPDDTRFSYNFYMEDGSVTILSAALMASASCLSYALFFATPCSKMRQKIFFLIFAIALTYMAIDEVEHFHEHLGDYLDSIGFMRIIFKKTAIRRWNDVIIILYGIVALPILIWFLPTAFQYPYLPEYFVIAFLCFVVHTTIDSFVDPPTTPSYIIEESMKLYTSTFLALGLFAGLIHQLKSRTKKALSGKEQRTSH